MRIDDRLRASVRKNWPDLRDLLLRRFPPFVYSSRGALTRDGLAPVFAFHDINRASFEACLGLLRERGFETLDCDRWSTGAPGVLLTFDDGRRSLYEVVYPLLKQYDCRAVAFICPGIVPNPAADGNRMLCHWGELAEMHGSGYVDVQSHGLRHDLVFVDDQAREFLAPGFESCWTGPADLLTVHDRGRDITIGTLRRLLDDGIDAWLGVPVFQQAPREMALRRYLPDRSAIESMRAFVRAEGGPAFFERHGPSHSQRILRDAFRERQRPGRFLSHEEMHGSRVDPLVEARERIEEHLSGKRVEHFCAPWYQATPATLEAAAAAGYRTVFLGADPKLSRTHHDVRPVQRVPGSFLDRLPGGRRSGLMRAFLERG